MASKAYVSSMTVAELTSELKKRGLNCRGKKKTLQNRLEQALYEEENSESSSEGNNEATIRDASVIINQLEGTGNNIAMATEDLTMKEPLIVSIEHSKRATDEGLGKQTNGERDKLHALQEREAPVIPLDSNKELILSDTHTSKPAQPGEELDTNIPPATIDEPQPVTKETVAMETGTRQLSVITSALSTPIKMATSLEVDLASTIISPENKDTGSESEVNSIAVEPPSPTRDDISFPVDVSLIAVEDSSSLSYERDGKEAMTPSMDGLTQEEPVLQIATDKSILATSEVKLVSSSGEKVGVSSVSAIGSGQIEVDLVVPTVEEDFSVFSVEADEARHINVSSCDNIAQPVLLTGLASDGEKGLGGVVSDNDNELNRKRQISLPDVQEKKDSESSKRRRISTSPKRLQERRRRWGSSTSKTPTSYQPSISSETLETIIPKEVKDEVTEASVDPIVEEEEVDKDMGDIAEEMETNKEQEEERGDKQDEEDIVDLGKESSMMDEYEREWQDKEKEKEQQRREIGRARRELETRRSLDERKNDDSIKRERIKPRSPSPPRNPPNRILHVENLKRPFTIGQLKELLQEDGPMINGGFWTNKIKSHCIVIFTSSNTAVAARNRLHGLKWPSINPQLLKVDFLTNRQVTDVSEGCLVIDSRSPSPVEPERTPQVHVPQEEKEEKPPVIIEKKKEEVPVVPLKEEKATRVLDDLFLKTKTTPPLYWIPLSQDEMDRKDIERKAHEEERDKRRAERRKEMEELEQERKEKRRKEEKDHRGGGHHKSPRRSRHTPSRYSRSRTRSPKRR